MNERIKLSKKQQVDFLQKIKIKSRMHADELGELCNVTGRTIRDWMRAKYTLPKEAAFLLSERFNVVFPVAYKILKQYWYIQKYAGLGGAARQKLYGLLGDVESRRKGGRISQARRRENPEKYRLLGCKVRKQIQPLKYSTDLAELCGILLGDGCVTNTQVSVSLHRYDDKLYSIFVSKLFNKIFHEYPYNMVRKNVIVLILSGVNLVEALEKVGLRRGNKVAHQVGIPKWITQNPGYARACLRGLIDTDGCVYTHRHNVSGHSYLHVGLNFSSHSWPLLSGVNQTLKENGIKSSFAGHGVYVYDLNGVKKYFSLIGSSNPKLKKKFDKYLILKAK